MVAFVVVQHESDAGLNCAPCWKFRPNLDVVVKTLDVASTFISASLADSNEREPHLQMSRGHRVPLGDD